MPVIPTTAEIQARIVADIEASIGQTTPLLPKAWNRVIAKAVAGVVILLYNAALWVYAQIFPDKADYAALILLGKLVGISPIPANPAVITANVAGTNGVTVTVGTNFKSTTGNVYQVTTGATVAGGAALCTLTSLTGGDAGNIANGEILSILSPFVGLTGTATVVSTTTEGADEESEDHFRIRVSNRYKKRYTGGSPADYEGWGLEAPHFIWVSPVDGNVPGDIWVYGEVDNQTDGIPTSGQLATLLQYLTYDTETGLASRRPIGDNVTCMPITRKEFDVDINIKDSTPAIKAEIETALAEYFGDLAPFAEGLDLDRNDAVTDTGTNTAVGDIARTGGATILQLILREGDSGQVINNYLLYGGEKAKLGTVTWTDIE